MGREEKKTTSKQIYRISSKPVRVDTGLHQLLKIKAAKSGISIKTLLEGLIIEGLKDETAGKENSS